MKTLKSLLYVFLAAFLFVGCNDDENFNPGEPEDPDCYSVYFPTQENIGSKELDPAAPTEMTFTVRRLKSEGAIVVPVAVTSSEEGIFVPSQIEFADGQEETTFSIQFPQAEIGTTYKCEVNIEDKKYACRARGYNKNEKVDVVIRPEHLDIVPRAEGMLKGTVKSQLFKGMHYETVVETRVGTSITVKMQVSQDRPVFNEEKGEKISANAFLLDVEDVEELDEAKIVALASAEAWDAETEEPISIKTVEYDIKPETGNYTVTFSTANETSITVKVLVVAENRVESKVYQEEIYAMNFFKKVEDIQESIALDTDLETWASASAWSLEDGEQVEITDVKYDFDPETITPGVYDVTFSTEGYEYKVSTTHAFEEGEQVGLVFRPEDIHVMKKEGQW